MTGPRKHWSQGLAIIAGHGSLPQLLAEKCRNERARYVVVELENAQIDWLENHPVIRAGLEQQDHLINSIKAANCGYIVLAGSMQRFSFDPLRLDEKGRELAGLLAASKTAGDDSTLRIIISYLESYDFTVVAADEILTDLLPQAGVLTKAVPSAADRADAQRASEIVAALGKADVGQGAVVGQGICIALESISGTDSMLDFAKLHRKNYLPDPDGAAGLLFKAPKPDQDRRVDLPAIGPTTFKHASEAGLAGVVIEAGGVMVIDRQKTIELANKLGRFLWVRPAL